MSDFPIKPADLAASPALRRLFKQASRSGQTVLLAVGRRIALAWQIRAERRRLAALPDEALQDIGITRYAARAESSRGLFDLPSQRKNKTDQP